MEFDWLRIIYFLFLFDSIGAFLMSLLGRAWWTQNFGVFAKQFPLTKGWTSLYVVLMLVIGYLLVVVQTGPSGVY